MKMNETDRERYIEAACDSFRKLIGEQLDRQERMEESSERKDFASLEKIVIGVCPGDGIGPAITGEAVRVLKKLMAEELLSGRIGLRMIEGLTIENRERTGKSVPDDVLAAIKACDVLLKGPTTTPKGGTMESANVTLRRELDLFANVRPVSIPEEGIDWTFFRENTEGEYVLGSKGVEIPGKLAMDFKVTTKAGTERIARAAFDHAAKNGKTRVAIVTKANIMKKTDGSFSEICHRVAEEYPGIEAEDYYIDIMTANLVKKPSRSRFQVFLLPNLYGDILTDEAAEIQGGVGTAGSANIGDRYAMFEAIHGTALRMVEEGRDKYADPTSMFKASELMLRHIGYAEKADRLAGAVKAASDTAENDPKYKVTGRPEGATGAAFADLVMSFLG